MPPSDDNVRTTQHYASPPLPSPLAQLDGDLCFSDQSSVATLPSILLRSSSLVSFSSWSQIMENSLVSSSSFLSLAASVTRQVSWMTSRHLGSAFKASRQTSASSSMVSLQICAKSSLAQRDWLQIFLMRLRFSGRSPSNLARQFSTFLTSSSKNIFMTVKSFLNLSMILSRMLLLTKSLYCSSVKALLLMFFSLRRMQLLQVIMHCHLESTRMKISARCSGMLSFSMAKQLWILRERWLRKTALLRLKRNQFLILRMTSFLLSVSSYFCAIDLQMSCSLDSLASRECTTEISLSSMLLVSSSCWITFLSSKQIWFILVDMSSLSFDPFCARLIDRLMSFGSFSFSANSYSEKMSFQDIRYSGAYFSITSNSSCSPGVDSFCGYLMIFLFTFEISSYRLVALCGVFPYSIWQKITPIDQTSLLVEQVLPLRISGHMYMGLPTRDWWIWSSSAPSWQYLAKPKSAILQVSSLMRMLAGLRSRWMTECSCRYLQPRMSCLMMITASASGSFLRFSRTSSRLPLSHSSWKRQMLLADFLTSQSSTMLSFLMAFMISISFLSDSQNFSGSFLMLAVEMVFTAMRLPVRMSAPLQTSPYDPRPIFSLMLMMKGSTNLQQEVPSFAASSLIFAILLLSILSDIQLYHPPTPPYIHTLTPATAVTRHPHAYRPPISHPHQRPPRYFARCTGNTRTADRDQLYSPISGSSASRMLDRYNSSRQRRAARTAWPTLCASTPMVSFFSRQKRQYLRRRQSNWFTGRMPTFSRQTMQQAISSSSSLPKQSVPTITHSSLPTCSWKWTTASFPSLLLAQLRRTLRQYLQNSFFKRPSSNRYSPPPAKAFRRLPTPSCRSRLDSLRSSPFSKSKQRAVYSSYWWINLSITFRKLSLVASSTQRWS